MVKKKKQAFEVNGNSTPRGFNLLHTLTGHQGAVSQIVWSQTPQNLLSASLDGSLRLWNLDKNTYITIETTFHESAVYAAAISPRGNRIISGTGPQWASDTLKIWEIYKSDVIRSYVLPPNKSGQGLVRALAISPDGNQFASIRGGIIAIWDLKNREVNRSLEKIPQADTLAWSPTGYFLACGAEGSIRVWNTENWEQIHKFESFSKSISSLAWSPNGRILASACKDNTIHLWEVETGKKIIVLEGHMGPVTSVSFSADKRLLASKSMDGTVRLWHCDTWKPVAVLQENYKSDSDLNGLAFHSNNPNIIATLGEQDTDIRIWELDYQTLFNDSIHRDFVYYTSAKIALVGESGVGKSGLGYRVAEKRFRSTDSTHGQHFWVIDELGTSRQDGTECEAVLWDFAGQPDYRLIHALFLEDVELALLLFDSSNQQEPLKGVEFWLKQLPACRKILVAARIDRGMAAITQKDIDEFCKYHNISGGYIAVSALTGENISDLIQRIKSQIIWDAMATTVTPQTFKYIKEYVLKLKADVNRKTVLVSWKDLRKKLELHYADKALEGDFTDLEMKTAVGHLQTHGYVMILRSPAGDENVLLTPELLIKLASSFVLEARRNPKGLGALEEERVRRGEYSFPELASLEKLEQDILLDAAMNLFVKRNICLREISETQTLLVFPSLINQKRPLIEDFERIDGASYIVKGVVERIYPSLVVLLGYTNIFRRTNQWQNQAQYQMGDGEICGFQQTSEREGEVEFVLYFAKETRIHTQNMFEGLFERLLHQKNVEIAKYPPIICTNKKCNAVQERNIVIKRISSNKKYLFCSECGKKIKLGDTALTVSLTEDQRRDVEQQQIVTQLRTDFAEKLTYLKRIVEAGKLNTPKCFISYAWGVPEHEKWVLRLAIDLREAGIDVLIDRWHAAAFGTSLPRFMTRIQECNFILVVGTQKYREKYDNKGDLGTGVGVEGDLANIRLSGTELEKESVIPLLLSGDPKISLPPLLQGRTYGDFRNENYYFANLFDLLLTLYHIGFDNRAVVDLREDLKKIARSIKY